MKKLIEQLNISIPAINKSPGTQIFHPEVGSVEKTLLFVLGTQKFGTIWTVSTGLQLLKAGNK